MAKSVPSLADRDLHRIQDEADRIPGVLGIHVARTQRTVALPEVDGRDGTLCPSQAEEFLKFKHVRAGTRQAAAFSSSGISWILAEMRRSGGMSVYLNGRGIGFS